MGQRIFSNMSNDSPIGKGEIKDYLWEKAFGLQGTHVHIQNADNKTFKQQRNYVLIEYKTI